MESIWKSLPFGNTSKRAQDKTDKREKEQTNKIGLKQTLKSFGESTSIKGIPKVLKTQQVILKVVWFIALVLGAAAAIYQLTLLLVNYYSYDYVTRIQTCNDCRPPFPDVTVCNLNPLNIISNINLTEEQAYSYDEYMDAVDIQALRILSNETEMNRLLGIFGRTEDELSRDIYNEAFSLSGYYQTIHDQVEDRIFSPEFHRALIRNCTWYGWDNKIYPNSNCTDDNIYAFYNPEYFICFTIHMNETLPRASNKDISSMIALLYLNDFPTTLARSYVDSIYQTQAKGARLLVHPPNTIPDMTGGFNIPPGHEISIRLSATDIKLPGVPYEKCSDQRYIDQTEEHRARSISVDDIKIAYKYSDTACLALCHQERIVKECGCFHPHLPLTDHLRNKYSSTQSCGKLLSNVTRVVERINCYLFVNEDHEVRTSCHCDQRCEANRYDFNVHQSAWPQDFYKPKFWSWNIKHYDDINDKFRVYRQINRQRLRNVTRAIEMLEETEDLIGKNFIQLKINFQGEGKTLSTGVAAITFTGMFGSMAGILNLWVGITFFTLIELLDLLYKLVESLVKSKKMKADQNQVKPLTVQTGLNRIY